MPFNRTHTTSYQSSTVTIHLSCTVSEISAHISQNCKRSHDPGCTPYCGILTRVMVVLFTFNLQTKFEMSSFIHSKDMAWTLKCRNGSPDPDHTHLGNSWVIKRLILHVANSCAKPEVSRCSHCRGWKILRRVRDDLSSAGWDDQPIYQIWSLQPSQRYDSRCKM